MKFLLLRMRVLCASALSLGLCSCTAEPRTAPALADSGVAPPPGAADSRVSSAPSASQNVGAPKLLQPAAQDPVVIPAPRVWGSADLDPDNDGEVAPPDAVPECEQRLTELGAVFSPGELSQKQLNGAIPTCGANDAVVLKALPGGVKLRPAALLTCQMALGLCRFAPRISELAEKHLKSALASVEHVGTYNCRKMVRFDLVSEHSYGNAIDVRGFVLQDGRKLNVKQGFGVLDSAPTTSASAFLREVGNVAFDEQFFSVSLGPYWDSLHADHYHFDQARYRVDGSRPRP